MSFFYAVLIIFFSPLLVNADYLADSAYYRLKTALYDGYDQYIRPVRNPSTVTQIKIGFTLKQVLSFVS